jgi:hypothetical protein
MFSKKKLKIIIQEDDGSEEMDRKYEEKNWKRDESGRLNRKDGETCVELLKTTEEMDKRKN